MVEGRVSLNMVHIEYMVSMVQAMQVLMKVLSFTLQSPELVHVLRINQGSMVSEIFRIKFVFSTWQLHYCYLIISHVCEMWVVILVKW